MALKTQVHFFPFLLSCEYISISGWLSTSNNFTLYPNKKLKHNKRYFWRLSQQYCPHGWHVRNCIWKYYSLLHFPLKCGTYLKTGCLFLKKILFTFFRESGREEEREGEKHQCVVVFCMPSTGNLAWNSGMCPDWESNQLPFGSKAGTQSIEPHHPGWKLADFCLDFLSPTEAAWSLT